MKRYLVYLEVPVIAVGKMAIFVTDENDLKEKTTTRTPKSQVKP